MNYIEEKLKLVMYAVTWRVIFPLETAHQNFKYI